MIEQLNQAITQGNPVMIQRSETITTFINHELIDKILNIRSFTGYTYKENKKVRVRCTK
jgi:hypothetical protein